MSESSADQDVIDGKVWTEFCESLLAAGEVIQRPEGPKDAFNKAEGYRYLTRLLRASLETFIEYNDADFPTLRCTCHETIKLGADNPDNYYMSAKLNPQLEYRLRGQRGTVDYLGISTVNNQYGTGGGMETTGFLDSRQLTLDANGSFDVILSQSPPSDGAADWLPMTPETNQINVRQTFQDREHEIRAEIIIERLGGETTAPPPLSPKKFQAGLRNATQFIQNTTGLFAHWVEGFAPHTNQLPPADQGFCQAIGGDPNIYYFHSNWQIAADECLVIKAPVIPECQTWNFQIDNWWMESLDYRYHQIHVNKHTAEYDDDGGVCIVIAHQNPGCANWLDTAGHDQGSMCFRWIGASEHPDVSCDLIKLADLADFA